MDKSKVMELLRSEWVKIEFTKVDGSIRQMLATLAEDQLPTQTETKTARKSNDSAVAVWDVNANGWRSFRWESLQTVNGESFNNA